MAVHLRENPVHLAAAGQAGHRFQRQVGDTSRSPPPKSEVEMALVFATPITRYRFWFTATVLPTAGCFREQVVLEAGAEDADRLVVLRGGEEVAFGEHKPAHILVGRRGRHRHRHLGPPLAPSHAAGHEGQRDGGPDTFRLLDGGDVALRQGADPDRAHRVEPELPLRVAGHDEDQVGAEALDLRRDLVLGALADCDEQNRRSDADHHAQHGQ